MPFLNKQERDALLDQIKSKKFRQIQGILIGKDQKARLAYFRNVQESGRWMTRYVLETLGTQVTLVEKPITKGTPQKPKQDYELIEIIVEPTPSNRL
jgi:hypothetical protein